MNSRTIACLALALFSVVGSGCREGTAAAQTAVELHWSSDLQLAQASAARADQPLLIYFTGSKWCGPCIALHDDVLSGAEFSAMVGDYVLVHLDYPPLDGRTPEKIAANPALTKLMAIKDRYRIPGFPTLLFLDSAGAEKGRLSGYGEGATAFLRKVQKLTES